MPTPRRRVPVVALCFIALAFEGYDLVAYGSVLPQLLASDGWDIGPEMAGLIGTLTVIGMLIGSLLSGGAADYVGRRVLTASSCAWFSVWMIGCALAPNGQVLGFARFCVGLGIGAFVPLIAALAVEAAPSGKGNRNSAIAWAGYPVGGVIAALVGYVALEPLGARFLFALGSIPLMTLVPLMVWGMPELDDPQRSRRRENARTTRARRRETQNAGHVSGPPLLFVDGAWVRTCIFGLMSACGLMLTYGLNTWLPELMRANGYDLGPALLFLVVLNVGAAVVPPILGWRADVNGPRFVIACVFLAASVSLVALIAPLPLLVLYALVFVAGAGTLGAQLLLPGFVATEYSTASRVAALSWISCAGRIGALGGPTLIGFLIAADGDPRTSFFVFAGFGILGALLTVLLPRRRNGSGRAGISGPGGSELGTPASRTSTADVHSL